MIPAVTPAQLAHAVNALTPYLATPAGPGAGSASPHPSGGSATTRPTSPADIADRARAYLRTIPPAVAGQRGHDRTFYAANRLVRGFGLTPADAFPLLAEWNSRCDPPWSEFDLMRKLEQAGRQPGPRGFLLTADPPPPGRHRYGSTDAAGGATTPAVFRNYVWDERQEGDTTRKFKRGRRGEELVEELTAFTGGWPRRVGKALFARDKAGGIYWILDTGELFAWIDWQFSIDGGRGFDWASGTDCLSMESFLKVCRIHCEPWEQVELYPHEPPLPGHYYHHPEVPADAADGSHLTDLVRRFHPYTPEDEDLIRLFFVTLVWGGLPKSRPMFLFESASTAAGKGRGAGKSTVAQIGSALVGGYVSISPGEQLRDVQTRLLSPECLTRRVTLIDNLKSLRFSDSHLEGLVTAPVISGRQLFTGEGRRPNTFTWVVTSNKPSLSSDLAGRSVIIRVTTPVYGPEWEKSVLDHIERNRWKIIADCVRELRLPGRLPDGFTFSRWAAWENEVLSKARDPARLAAELVVRRGEVDDDKDRADDVTEIIREMLRAKHFDPDADCVLIPSTVLYEEVVKKMGGRSATEDQSSGLKRLYTLGIDCLSKHDASLPYRGGVWRPDGVPADRKPQQWVSR